MTTNHKSGVYAIENWRPMKLLAVLGLTTLLGSASVWAEPTDRRECWRLAPLDAEDQCGLAWCLIPWVDVCVQCGTPLCAFHLVPDMAGARCYSCARQAREERT